MPKYNKNIAYKDPVNLSAAEENAERVLQEVEAENREFYDRNAAIAQNTSTIQSGIRLKAGKTIGDPFILREKITEERVQSDLYRAVAGNEAVETGKGVDSKNYEQSINARFLEGGKVKKGSKLLHKVKNAILDAVGSRDFVKEESQERFGKNQEINEQKKYVAQRHAQFLTDLELGDPLSFDSLKHFLGLTVTANKNQMIATLAGMESGELGQLKADCIANDIPIVDRPEFLDLIMLNDVRQRALSKFGMMEVYDLKNLRSFWSTLTTGSAAQKAFTDKVSDLLLNNSLIDLDRKPESVALLAQIRSLYLQNLRVTGDADLTSSDMKAELDKIEAEELPKTTIAAAAGGAPTVGPAEKVSPFVLLQRLLRREYCARRKLDPKNFSLEADNFSSVQAALRVADVKKNVDMFRSSNDKAAELAIGKAKTTKILNKVGIGNAPDTNEVLEDIIKNQAEFKIFAGVNKYTTRREIRQIMNRAGSEIAGPTMERFIAVLQEALSRFKKGRQLDGTHFGADDWDLEELVMVLQTLKAEQWSNKLMEEAADDPGTNMEEKLIKLMQASRKKEEEVADEILADVSSPEAIWKVMAAKNELKKLLNKEALQGRLEFNKGVIAAKKLQISQLSPADPQKKVLEDEIKAMERNDKSSTDLAERVNAARKYIKEKNLSGKAKNAYLEAIGLAGVWDKMAYRFWWEDKKEAYGKWREERKKKSAEKATKKAAEKASQPQTDSKIWSIFKRALSPATALGSLGYSGTSYIPRMIFRGIAGASRLPKRLVGTVSDSHMHSYLTDRLLALSEEVSEIDDEIKALNARLARAPYAWDSRRINRRINALNLAKAKLGTKITALHNKAAERKLPAITGAGGKKP